MNTRITGSNPTGRKGKAMKVKQLTSVASYYEWISVEDNEYNAFAFDEAPYIVENKAVANMEIECFYGGYRNNKPCIIVIVKKGKGNE